MTDQTTPERRRRDGKSKFMALRETITREFAEGHTARAIYDRHLGQAGLSYSQFARYVARYVRTDDGPETKASPPSAAPQEQRPPAPQPVDRSEQPARADRPQSGIGVRFQHNAKPDDDDKLI